MFPLRFSASTHARPQARTHLHADIYSPINMSRTYIYIRYFLMEENNYHEVFFVILESKPSTFFERLARIPTSSFHSPSSPSHLSSHNFSNDNKRRCPVCLQTFVKRRQWRTWQTHDETKRLDERVPWKRNYDSAIITSLQLGHVDIRPHCVHRFALSLPKYELHILLTLLNHVHLPSRRCL